MIGVLYPQPQGHVGQLVLAAFQRSVSTAQACAISMAAIDTVSILVAVNVPDSWGAQIVEWLGVAGKGRKLLVFGTVPGTLIAHLGWKVQDRPSQLSDASRSSAAPQFGCSESAASVIYGEAAKSLGGASWRRAFERFDFTDEWNNLGFGAIRDDASCWALSMALDAAGDEIASVHIGQEAVTSYSALADRGAASVLWINRGAGSIDSFEWRLVENFISGYRSDQLYCQPVLREIPFGFDTAITSRLDCDEDVESARPLWQTYRELAIPFSLAVHTQNLKDERHHVLLRDLVAADEAVLSHTATHAPNWGGSYDAALGEGLESASLLRDVIGEPVRYAVSPFHQTPDYALQGLADAGYAGCIGGIIRNDPDFLLARGGVLAGMPDGFVGHSQQCMLHGDCMLSGGDPLAIFKQAFDQAMDSATLFGYLDHPFSERYAYGWESETQRIQAHTDLIAYIRSRSVQPVFMNENVAMDFLQMKGRVQVIETKDGFVTSSTTHTGALQLAIDFKNEVVSAQQFQAV